MNTLGRGQTKVSALPMQRSGSRRVPSLDQLSTRYQAKDSTEVKTPTLKTPGTASSYHHQRNVSCPSPTVPFGEQFGAVYLMVTPPTPRPQGPGSPTFGVHVSGIAASQRGNSARGHARSYSDNDAQLLAPPAFELAPGKQRALDSQRTNAIAWLATLQAQREQMEQLQQQQHQMMLLSSLQYTLPNAFELMASNNPLGLTCSTDVESPKLIPGTPGAPSKVHILQQKAIFAQQQMLIQQYQNQQAKAATSSPPPKVVAKASPASTNSSWWRSPQQSASVDSASSCSVYSKSSGVSSGGFASTSSSSSAGGVADSSPVWRRREAEVTYPEKVKLRGAVYVPPGKRAAMSQRS
jgi:hypothetical protein